MSGQVATCPYETITTRKIEARSINYGYNSSYRKISVFGLSALAGSGAVRQRDVRSAGSWHRAMPEDEASRAWSEPNQL